jgi:hypothetical protein
MSETAPPLGGRGIVYFGNDWFAENRTSSHHIASRLARVAPLLYVSSPGMRAPQASGRDLGRMLRKLRASLRPPVEVAPGLWHCTVPQLPFRRIPGVDLLNRAFGRWARLGMWTPLWSCYGLGFLAQLVDAGSVLFDQRLRQALHDKSAATVVVAVPPGHREQPVKATPENADDSTGGKR